MPRQISPFSAAVSLCFALVLAIAATPTQLSASALPDHPSVAELFSARVLPEPLVPTSSTPTDEENQHLVEALRAFEARTSSDDFASLEACAQANPTSPWRLAILTNLGLLQYRAGYFSLCIPTFLAAWEAGKNATEPKAKALADRAAGEYVKMLARLGRLETLKPFLAEVKSREFVGQASELILAGLEGSTLMELHPELAYRCGPMALSRILASQGSPFWTNPILANSNSTAQGIALADVAALSAKVGLNFQVAKRTPGAPPILPSVVHWKVGHYAALTKLVGDRFLTEDPTFEDQIWHSREALDAESSGYFLVPPGDLPTGWIAVSEDEAATIFGKGAVQNSNPQPTPNDPTSGGPNSGTPNNPPPGYPNSRDPNNPPPGDPNSRDPNAPPSGGPGDPNDPKTCPGTPMASYSFRLMLASLQIADSPVGYRPPYGYPVYFMLTYVQRDPNQPSNFNYSNLGPKWAFNWQRYITDDPGNTAVASQATSAGAAINYSAGVSAGGYITFPAEFNTHKVLRRPVSIPIYEVTNPDGSREIFGQSDGSTVAPRKIFLTQMIDRAGNATTLTYDANMRVTRITDSLGQQTVFSYEIPGDIYKISKVTDPFGRFADFAYDSLGRLTQITDVIGIQSKFTYNGSTDFINSLTTPYGTTNFTNTESGSIRRLTATDPAGDTEVLESNYLITAAISFSESAAPVIPGAASQFNSYLWFRNSFHWNKKQWKEGANDYTKAHLYHWMHDKNFSQMSPYLESEKEPLQSRIWYVYPGQSTAVAVGTEIAPSAIGRAIEGGSQVTLRTHNALGKITKEIDPMGRVTNYIYSSDGIDLLSITHAQTGGAATLATYTYNTQHLPLTITDAAGQTTTFTYNAVGQPLTITNAKNETTTLTYYATDVSGKQRMGRLASLDGPLVGTADTTTFDYDAVGHTASITGSDGYTLAYSYDVIDRLTRTTYPDATYTETTYLALDPQTSRDRLGRITTYVYNSIRQLESVTDPSNRTIQYKWCKCGDLQQLIDAMGRITFWRHDVAGRVTSKEYADGSKITYAYEPLSGRLRSVTDERSQVKTYTYNLDHTLANLAYTNTEHPTPNVAYTYDPEYRRVLSMVDGVGTTNYWYNPITATATLGAGRLAAIDGPWANDTITYAYDPLGRVTSRAIDGVSESTAFDSAGRTESITNPLGTFTYTYDGATARLARATHDGGVAREFSYLPNSQDRRLQRIRNLKPDGTTPFSVFDYTYDVQGRITTWKQQQDDDAAGAQTWSLGYDAADQLTSNVITQGVSPVSNSAWTYDDAANRTSETVDGVATTACYNALNELTSRTAPLPATTYEWDGENRLVAVNQGRRRSEFSYDGQGRRVQIIEKTDGAVTIANTYLWDGLTIREVRDATGNALQQRCFAQGFQDVPGVPSSGRLYLQDHLGSVRDITNTTGDLIERVSYDVWGNPAFSNTNSTTHFTYTGHFWHGISGLQLAPFREYFPRTGRWLSRDPLAEQGGSNLYCYVENMPVNSIDPLGLMTWRQWAQMLIAIHNLGNPLVPNEPSLENPFEPPPASEQCTPRATPNLAAPAPRPPPLPVPPPSPTSVPSVPRIPPITPWAAGAAAAAIIFYPSPAY